MGEVRTPREFEDEFDETTAARGTTQQELASAAIDHLAESRPVPPEEEDALEEPLDGEA